MIRTLIGGQYLLKTIKRILNYIIVTTRYQDKQVLSGPKRFPNKISRSHIQKGKKYLEVRRKLLSMYPKYIQYFRKVGAIKSYLATFACKFNSSQASNLCFTPSNLQGHLWRRSLKQIPRTYYFLQAIFQSLLKH